MLHVDCCLAVLLALPGLRLHVVAYSDYSIKVHTHAALVITCGPCSDLYTDTYVNNKYVEALQLLRQQLTDGEPYHPKSIEEAALGLLFAACRGFDLGCWASVTADASLWSFALKGFVL